MALTTTQRDEVKRILGYPQTGSSASVQLGYPAYASPFAQWQPYAWLESRLTQMSASEEVIIFGAESALCAGFFTPASLRLTLSTPSAIPDGTVLQVDVDGATASVQASADTPATLATKIAAAMTADATDAATTFASAAGAVLSIGARAIGAAGNGVVVQAFSSSAELLVDAGAGPVQFAVGMTVGGANPPGPILVPEGATQTLYGYVPIIRVLEGDLGASRENLSDRKAGEWEPRADEMQARAQLLRRYRVELAARLNVPLDPDLVGNRGRRGFRRI